MTHTYTVTGMTCNGSRGHINKTLNTIFHVTNTTVDLEKVEAIIIMGKHIPLSTFQEALKK